MAPACLSGRRELEKIIEEQFSIRVARSRWRSGVRLWMARNDGG